MTNQTHRSPGRKVSVRALFDLIMGIIYCSIGMLLLIAEKVGWKLAFPPKEYAWIFGLFSLLYGLFRCYRGYRSFYQSEE